MGGQWGAPEGLLGPSSSSRQYLRNPWLWVVCNIPISDNGMWGSEFRPELPFLFDMLKDAANYSMILCCSL